MSQQEQLTQISENFKKIGDPVILNKIYGHFDADREKLTALVKVGDKFPSFELQDATGKNVTSAELLQKGPLLVNFYRGGWCPYCNIVIQHLQRHLDDFTARGVTLVAISPELPDYTLTTTEKHNLKFPVLTDQHNMLAKQLGILYDQSSARELHDKLGVDLNARNGEATWEVPIPASILIDATGTVRATHIEVDFRKRLDPKVALEWIDAMKAV